MATSPDAPKPAERGPIAWMARNPVAANLAMAVILVGGLLGLLRTKQEVFPEFDLDMVVVQVPYPGASPTEVEQGIVLAAEEAVRGIDGVKRVTSKASEGVGTVSIELLIDADADRVLNDVKTAIDRIRSFPLQAEEPVVTLATMRRQVISLVIAGDQDLSTLHALAERAREALLAKPEITQVELEGVPPVEVSIEVPREALQSYGLSLEDVARAVRAASLELPGGELETRSGELLVRVNERRRAGHEFRDIILRSTRTGAAVRLGDIATIRDGYADTDQASSFNGRPAVRVIAYRVGDETPIAVSDAVKAYVEELRAELPDNVEVAVWSDDSRILRSRIDLLMRNAAMGLVLVLLTLALFLKLRLAFWVALGIPISFLGAFLLMPGLDVSINMISLFALIVTLGMVVDDAIIVGENAYAKMQEGLPPLKAAIAGAREMAQPVTFAILTTLATFAPLMFVPGTRGKLFEVLPLVVGAVLVFSLIESFFILPAHVGHMRRPDRDHGMLAAVARVQAAFSRGLDGFTDRVYRPFLERAVRWRWVTVAAAVAAFALTAGLVFGGFVPYRQFPKLEGDQVTATVRLPYGAPPEQAEQARRALEGGARAAIEEKGWADAVQGIFTRVGEGPSAGHGRGPAETGGHLVTVEISLVPTDERSFASAQFEAAWKRRTPVIPGAEAVTFNSQVGPASRSAIDVQLSHSHVGVLARASAELSERLRNFSELTDIENTYASGKPRLDFEILPQARALGLTADEIARQLRAAFYGAEALREQRGRNEVKVMVRLPEAQRRSEHDLEELRVRTPAGALVPLAYVARFERGRAPVSIEREEGRRIVNVRANLAPSVVSPQPVIDALNAEVLPALRRAHPGLSIELVGDQREQGETFGSLRVNFVFALLVIYALLAIPFRSYLQPIAVMSAIPFGWIGAVLGHLALGYELSLISLFGLIALSGVAVNDSLVLVDAANGARRRGDDALTAILWAGARRLRPILLTSLTTFFGLMPMIFETSVQARFLIPMAISLGFGVLFATLVALVVVPAVYMIIEDLSAFRRRLFARAPAPEAAPSSSSN